MNKVILMGRLTRDPEVRYTQGDNSLCIANFSGTKGLLQKVPVDKVRNFESEFLFFLHQNHAGILENLHNGKLVDEDLDTLKSVALDMAGKYAK